ncbi:MAG TPA: hypothetical protein VEB68_09490 [Croceibacterium sp.]|nr:hypothetical protein [Croceibacterium sp.]
MATLPAALAPARGWRLAVSRGEAVALACLGLALLLQLELAFAKSVNWDEFYHFSEIHQYRLGRWSPSLQTPYVHLFSWVPGLPGDNIAHIQLVRALILPFELATLVCIYAMARCFAGRAAALICALAYATGGYVLLHALAIRADMIAAALLSAALWIALCRPLRALELAALGLLLALAFVATIKSALYAPAFLGVALLRFDRSQLRRIAGGAAAAGVAALVVVSLVVPLAGLTDFARNSAEWMFSAGLFPQGPYLIKQVTYAPALAVLLALGAVVAWQRYGARERAALLCLFAPLLTVAIYRNAYPYHFVFVLPPAMVAAAPAAEWLVRRHGAATLSLILLANAALLSLTEDRSVLERQKTIQQGVREIFPQPVAYIDESGMIGNFPRAVDRFASGWALEKYHRAGHPVYRQALEAEPVPLLIGNSHALRNVFAVTGHADRLLAEDVRALRAGYIRHWGETFVAGMTVAPGTGGIEVAIPGPYTIEGGPISIDGRPFASGQVATLGRRRHRVQADGPDPVTLRWGDHLARPGFAWPAGPIFTDY